MILTHEQRQALYKVWLRDTTVAESYREFRRQAIPDSMADAVMLEWKGMWLGILFSVNLYATISAHGSRVKRKNGFPIYTFQRKRKKKKIK